MSTNQSNNTSPATPIPIPNASERHTPSNGSNRNSPNNGSNHSSSNNGSTNGHSRGGSTGSQVDLSTAGSRNGSPQSTHSEPMVFPISLSPSPQPSPGGNSPPRRPNSRGAPQREPPVVPPHERVPPRLPALPGLPPQHDPRNVPGNHGGIGHGGGYDTGRGGHPNALGYSGLGVILPLGSPVSSGPSSWNSTPMQGSAPMQGSVPPQGSGQQAFAQRALGAGRGDPPFRGAGRSSNGGSRGQSSRCNEYRP